MFKYLKIIILYLMFMQVGVQWTGQYYSGQPQVSYVHTLAAQSEYTRQYGALVCTAEVLVFLATSAQFTDRTHARFDASFSPSLLCPAYDYYLSVPARSCACPNHFPRVFVYTIIACRKQDQRVIFHPCSSFHPLSVVRISRTCERSLSTPFPAVLCLSFHFFAPRLV
jgi:hypothetical protein